MNGVTPQRPSLVHQPTSQKRKRLSDGNTENDMSVADDSGMVTDMDDMGGIHGAIIENSGPGWQGRIFEGDNRETKQMRTADNTPTSMIDDPFLSHQHTTAQSVGMSLPMTPATITGFPDERGTNGMDVDMSGTNANLTPGQNPLSVQPFSPTLSAPSSVGLLQPIGSTAQEKSLPMPMHEMQESEGLEVGQGMTELDMQRIRQEVANARNVHGPQCSTIPKLMLSDHADPVTGKRSMWTFCDSCGSCDMVV